MSGSRSLGVAQNGLVAQAMAQGEGAGVSCLALGGSRNWRQAKLFVHLLKQGGRVVVAGGHLRWWGRALLHRRECSCLMRKYAAAGWLPSAALRREELLTALSVHSSAQANNMSSSR